MTTTNGHTPDLNTLREQVERLRLTAELQHLEEPRILENWWGAPASWGNWGDAFDPGFSSPGPLGGMGGTPAILAGNRQSHRDGRNLPFIWNELNLDFARGQARWLAAENMIAQGALDALVDFTVGTGYTYEGRPQKGMEKDGLALRLAREVGRIVEETRDLNSWAAREAEIVRWSVTDGESIYRAFCQEDGTTLFREVPPEQMGMPASGDYQALFGIETDPQDIETAWAYHITYDGLTWDRVPAEDIAHLKRNVPRHVKRGMPDFYSTAESLDGLTKLIRNMQVGGAVQAAIPWIEEFDSASQATISAQVAQRRDQNRPRISDPITGQVPNYTRYPPGSVLKIGPGRKYQSAPLAGNTTQHTSIVQVAMRAISRRWGMPEDMISGDASNNNYASILVAGSPFVRRIRREQVTTYQPHFLRLLWIAVRNACRAGRLSVHSFEQVMRLVDIHVTPPKVEIANRAEEFQIDKGLVEVGAMSKQTLRARHDLDDDQERANLKLEPVQQPQQPQPGQEQPQGMQEALRAMIREEFRREAEEAGLLREAELKNGEFKDKAGRRICYAQGKRVACPKKDAPKKKEVATKMSVDDLAAHIGELKKGAITHEHLQAVAESLSALTVKELGALKTKLGVKASDPKKAGLVEKIKQKALGEAVPATKAPAIAPKFGVPQIDSAIGAAKTMPEQLKVIGEHANDLAMHQVATGKDISGPLRSHVDGVLRGASLKDLQAIGDAVGATTKGSTAAELRKDISELVTGRFAAAVRVTQGDKPEQAAKHAAAHLAKKAPAAAKKTAPARAQPAPSKALPAQVTPPQKPTKSEAEWRAHPTLAALGQKLSIKDAAHPKVQQHLEHLSKVSPALMEKVVAGGLKEIALGTGGIVGLDDMGALKGVRPRGWDEGATWDNVPGVYSRIDRKVVAGTGNHNSDSVALHEFGHSVGDLLGLDNSSAATEHHKRLFDKLKPYHQQGGPGGAAGKEEMIAEGIAATLMNRDRAVRLFDEPYVSWLEKHLSGTAGAPKDELDDLF